MARGQNSGFLVALIDPYTTLPQRRRYIAKFRSSNVEEYRLPELSAKFV